MIPEIMEVFKKFLLFIVIIFNISCSSTYQNISKNSFSFENNFQNYLFKAYKSKADFEAKQMHDWNSAKLYSEKALLASKGANIFPQKISYWKIEESKTSELLKAHENLMIIYEDSIKLDPYNLAKAVSSLDCWAEQQEENWQTWDINRCKKDFLSSMHNIYQSLNKNLSNKISNNDEIFNDSASIVTQNEDKENLQIIYFDFDKYKLSDVSLEKIKKFIESNKDIIKKYIIIGHTDTVGTKKYNKLLSIKRAETIKNVLISQGIKKESIKILGKGEGQLKVKTKDEIPHPANRRAEISPLN